MKIMILKDMNDDSVLAVLSCEDDVDTKELAKRILMKNMMKQMMKSEISVMFVLNFNLIILLKLLRIMVFIVFKDKRYRMCC